MFKFIIYLFMAVLDLCYCVDFLSLWQQGLLSAAMCGLLIAVASLSWEMGSTARWLPQLWLLGL